MLSLHPSSIDLKTTLPPDWQERIASYAAPPSIAPLVSELKSVVARLGDAAIAVEHVQAFARIACGLASQTMLEPYEHLFEMLRDAAGSDWPVTEVFPDAQLTKKPALDVAHRLIGCDGEWLVLAAFITAGWQPIRDPERKLGDWRVARHNVTLGVEAKAKQADGNSRGRLQFAFRGVAMLPAASFLNDYEWYWHRGIDLRQKWASRYFDLVVSELAHIEQVLRQPPELYVTTEVATTADVRLTVQRYEVNKFAFDFEPLTAKSDEERAKSAISLHAEPSRSPKYFVASSADAAMQRDDTSCMIKDLSQVLSRLNIEHQTETRTGDTVVAVIWEVPFQWDVSPQAVQNFWDRWCDENGVTNGILMPIHVGTRFVPVVTKSAAALALHEVDLNRLGEPDRMASKS